MRASRIDYGEQKKNAVVAKMMRYHRTAKKRTRHRSTQIGKKANRRIFVCVWPERHREDRILVIESRLNQRQPAGSHQRDSRTCSSHGA